MRCRGLIAAAALGACATGGLHDGHRIGAMVQDCAGPKRGDQPRPEVLTPTRRPMSFVPT